MARAEKAVAKILTQVMVTKREQEIKLDETDFDEKKLVNKRKKLIAAGLDADEADREIERLRQASAARQCVIRCRNDSFNIHFIATFVCLLFCFFGSVSGPIRRRWAAGRRRRTSRRRPKDPNRPRRSRRNTIPPILKKTTHCRIINEFRRSLGPENERPAALVFFIFKYLNSRSGFVALFVIDAAVRGSGRNRMA